MTGGVRPRAFRLRLPDPATLPLPAPVDRGRLLDAGEIATEFYHGKRSARWVREHLRHVRAQVPGRPVWWEAAVRDALGLSVGDWP